MACPQAFNNRRRWRRRMTTMSEYAALHGWEVGAQLRYKDSATPSTITAITHSEVRIATPNDFSGRLTFGPDIDHWKLVMDSVPVSLRARIKQLENSLAEAHSECDDLIAQPVTPRWSAHGPMMLNANVTDWRTSCSAPSTAVTNDARILDRTGPHPEQARRAGSLR